MKNFCLFILFISNLGISLAAHEAYPERSDWEIVSKVQNNDLKIGRTKMVFTMSGLPTTGTPQRLVWSANKWIDTVWMDDNHMISQVLISGKYNFKFYYNSEYREIIIPKLDIESGYTITVQLNFKSSKRENMMVKKPVIYLYPTKPTGVNLKVEPKGEMSFTYPSYVKEGWDFTAFPNGELAFCYQMLNYLFWEAEQDPSTIHADLSKGFVVEGKNTSSFLTDQLTKFGLNPKEQADFITFWGPELSRNDRNMIHFVINEEANQFADLNITPAPDHVYRIYILYRELERNENPELEPQELPSIDRSGFTVIEWGGSQLPDLGI